MRALRSTNLVETVSSPGFSNLIGGVFPAGRNPAGGVLPPQTKHVSQRVDGARAKESVRAFRGAQEPA